MNLRGREIFNEIEWEHMHMCVHIHVNIYDNLSEIKYLYNHKKGNRKNVVNCFLQQ